MRVPPRGRPARNCMKRHRQRLKRHHTRRASLLRSRFPTFRQFSRAAARRSSMIRPISRPLLQEPRDFLCRCSICWESYSPLVLLFWFSRLGFTSQVVVESAQKAFSQDFSASPPLILRGGNFFVVLAWFVLFGSPARWLITALYARRVFQKPSGCKNPIFSAECLSSFSPMHFVSFLE